MLFALPTESHGGIELSEVIAEFCAPVIIVYWVVLIAVLALRRRSNEAARRGAPPAPDSPWKDHSPLTYPGRWQRISVALCTLASGAMALAMLIQIHDQRGSFQSKMKDMFLSAHDIDYMPPWIALWAVLGALAMVLNKRAWKDPAPPKFERASRAYVVFWIHLAMMIFTVACSFLFQLRRAY